MNKIVLKFTAIAIISIVALLAYEYVSNLQKENKRLANNQAVLLDSVHFYKTADSLNAAKVNVLELSLSDYKKYREEDAALIKKLKAGKLSSSTNVQTSTTTNITTQFKDSIVYKDKLVPIDTLKQIIFDSDWTTARGYITNDSLYLRVVNREHLLITESLVKKKFLFFKLPVKLFGYKTKRLDVISKNPNTKITNLEFIQIYK